MARERLNAQRALEQMAAALSGDCEKVLDTGGTFFPTLMVWHEDDDLARPGAVVVFEPDTEDRRPGHALQLARERLDAFTRAAAGWALAYEGLVSENGDSSAAVLFEVALRRPPASVTLARRFRARSSGQPFRWTGEATPT